eukprot:CAMPEP_0177762936 /NCGR_PEP_ID=MMETSP0491_2-20121128/6605_1 /TAXON_ID=63592 /ORGANISM="Tetraselmis chuii, Strain PLY429" /LENGTH=140 /DNA_ID=CAMNT_0019279013 /DNA_START=104 /DNA_END=526 /DNA_ORIENTATION=-
MAFPSVKFQVNVTTEEQWQEEIYGVPGQVQVVEVYQGWAGPVKCIVSTLASIYFDLGDVPLKFYTACADHVEDLAEFRGHCQPVFLFFKDGKQFHRIDGVSSQQMRDEVDKIAAEYGPKSATLGKKPMIEHQKSLPAAAM